MFQRPFSSRNKISQNSIVFNPYLERMLIATIQVGQKDNAQYSHVQNDIHFIYIKISKTRWPTTTAQFDM